MGRYIAFEVQPEAGSYYRSDHFNFAKVGIPALYTEGVWMYLAKEKNTGSKEDEYRAKHYHRPSDEYDAATWTMEAIEDLKLLFAVGKRLAFEDKLPQWKDRLRI